ncbi:PRC-barrel domain protein [Sphingobium chlorophenolicum L-1]|uniref:PRC-barrel domain protein n=1 Tax=Sphingobium chlorophenolicum L-1 TaxID=690566 RepID=F6F2G9_SPHCR|nr:PRC-barrel domain-containing protein [Sphingobium chlorophenolicum]AEG50631.1 PRC-barrel domain protein [Sphingobium chlorophenolicum L-1]
MVDTIETDETSRLIASNKVEGTAVYNRQNERLGSIYNFMVDKKNGQVEYAVLQFGGFLGIGNDYYPLPWSILSYDTSQGGYVIDLDKDVLEQAPRYSAGNEPAYDKNYGNSVYDYYGVTYPY